MRLNLSAFGREPVTPQQQLFSMGLASIALFLSLSQSFTLVKAPSARPKAPAARKMATTYMVVKRRQDAPADRSPFHATERVLR